jgi:hypothetical protein
MRRRHPGALAAGVCVQRGGAAGGGNAAGGLLQRRLAARVGPPRRSAGAPDRRAPLIRLQHIATSSAQSLACMVMPMLEVQCMLI